MAKVWRPLADNKYHFKGTFVRVADEGKTLVVGHIKPIIVVSWEDLPANWRICELVEEDGSSSALSDDPYEQVQLLQEGVHASRPRV